MKPTSRRRPASRRPRVLLNLAVTADGKIATANRAVHAFGSPRDLAHLYALRATTDAVMCGARTVEISRSILDNGGPAFTRRRLRQGLAPHNLRIIVSGSGELDPAAEIFHTDFSPVILLTTARISAANLARLRPLVQEVKIAGRVEIDFRATLAWLRSKWRVRRLLCEGGGELNAALFQAGLVDEVHLTFCPFIFGGRQAPTLADGPNPARLAQAGFYPAATLQRAGHELFAVFSRRKARPAARTRTTRAAAIN